MPSFFPVSVTHVVFLSPVEIQLPCNPWNSPVEIPSAPRRRAATEVPPPEELVAGAGDAQRTGTPGCERLQSFPLPLLRLDCGHGTATSDWG